MRSDHSLTQLPVQYCKVASKAARPELRERRGTRKPAKHAVQSSDGGTGEFNMKTSSAGASDATTVHESGLNGMLIKHTGDTRFMLSVKA